MTHILQIISRDYIYYITINNPSWNISSYLWYLYAFWVGFRQHFKNMQVTGWEDVIGKVTALWGCLADVSLNSSLTTHLAANSSVVCYSSGLSSRPQTDTISTQ